MTNEVDWHLRYKQQARWTAELRKYFFSRYPFDSSQRIIEVGCGTGAVLDSIQSLPGFHGFGIQDQHNSSIFGLDINLDYLKSAKSRLPHTRLTQGDAHHLPFANSSFDLVFCHFLILWLKNPISALQEMCRVTTPGGWIAAFAEPDYGGRIDHPAAMGDLGRLQTESLQRQGADPLSGRQIKTLFNQAGLVEIECGVLGAQWSGATSAGEIEMEWQVIEADMKEILSAKELDAYRRKEKAARQAGSRILFVPTFYAFGRVPQTEKSRLIV